MQRIVVGVDGSEASRRALQWALEEAQLRGATVQAVHAWHEPYPAGLVLGAPTVDPEVYEATARRLLDEAVNEVDATGLPAPVTKKLFVGNAAGALLQAAKNADLVVIGSRGLGGFTGLLLGSVSQQVAHHAPCPVVIIPPSD